MKTQKQFWLRGAILGLVPCAALAGFFVGRMSQNQSHADVSSSIEARIFTAQQSVASAPSSTMSVGFNLPVAAPAWEEHWKTLMTKPCNRDRDDQVLAAIEELAARDSSRAIALALDEPRLRMRQNMLRAALRGWGKADANAASDWVLSQQNTLDKTDALASVLDGTMKDPDAAVRLYSRLSLKAPDLAGSLGMSLISTLANRGDFSRAANFATSAAPDDRMDWLNTAYSLWADYQPDSALAAANALTDATMKSQALDAIFSMWSVNSPQAAVDYASTLPAGHDREVAFTDSLRNWAANDPTGAAEWINQADSSPELDAGIAAIAASPQLLRQPSVAVSWAESITDPQLRSSTLADIVRHWVGTDPTAARRYVETTQNIDTDERNVLIAELGPRIVSTRSDN